MGSTGASTGIGIVFDVGALGGGSYGTKAWRILLRTIKPEQVLGCTLRHGDTQASMRGGHDEFCIAAQGAGLDLDAIRRSFEESSAIGLAALDRRFIVSPKLEAEPLVPAGVVDGQGRYCPADWTREFHDLCESLRWGYAPQSVPSDFPPEWRAKLDNLRQVTLPVAAQEAARARIEQAERRRREEEQPQREEERRRREPEEAARQAEAQRIAGIQASRRAAGNCALCGRPLGFLERVRRKAHHAACRDFRS